MMFLRRLPLRLIASAARKAASQKLCCTEPRAASQSYGDWAVRAARDLIASTMDVYRLSQQWLVVIRADRSAVSCR